MRAYLGYLLNQLLSHAYPLTKLKHAWDSKTLQTLSEHEWYQLFSLLRGSYSVWKDVCALLSLESLAIHSLDPFIFLGKDFFTKSN